MRKEVDAVVDKDIADSVLWLEDGQFRQMAAMAVDPVCGMSVDQNQAPAHAEYAGRLYYFCAKGCRDDSWADPGRYLAAFSAVNEQSLQQV